MPPRVFRERGMEYLPSSGRSKGFYRTDRFLNLGVGQFAAEGRHDGGAGLVLGSVANLPIDFGVSEFADTEVFRF